MQEIIQGDCLSVMQTFPDNHFNCVCTDPPYGISFMSKQWDKQIPPEIYWKELLRICKPGTILLSFGGDRTHHHLMNAIENAGWEIRTCLYWVTGQGFPKSCNFGKQLGTEWHGYGTALKPAAEIIVMAMKPLEGTYKENAEKWGVAGLNIDKSRIPSNDFSPKERLGALKLMEDRPWCKKQLENGRPIIIVGNEKGRWPSNLLLDEEAAQLLDQQSGIEPSRFFYVAKASSAERQGSTHPTMKPIKLMEYLIKLIAPPEPLLLDPFAGSGSTLMAAKNLGVSAIGVEISEEYCEIARKRIEYVEDKVVDAQYTLDL